MEVFGDVRRYLGRVLGRVFAALYSSGNSSVPHTHEFVPGFVTQRRTRAKQMFREIFGCFFKGIKAG